MILGTAGVNLDMTDSTYGNTPGHMQVFIIYIVNTLLNIDPSASGFIALMITFGQFLQVLVYMNLTLYGVSQRTG